ncbi:lipid A export permease/ATP-binding protein MsbA [Oleiagrimonas citrea]|uniref:Lipid A export permease/ATP-binding protein MsbA n=1 Tax=Oleiagrimonas citrea TaxID=1665687 RepID=A0A846ZIU7_9GAMM|nr:lipid A export permease/ATP-binding protein MsbA [Oleiagrimonas citrea]
MSNSESTSFEVSTWTTYKRLLGYARPYWIIALLAVIGMALDAAGLTVFASKIKPMLDGLFMKKDPDTIFWMPIWIVGIFLVRGMGAYMENYGTALVGRNVVQQIRMDIFNTYLRMTSAFFNREPSGHQIARITYTSEQVANATTNAVKVAVTDGLTVIGMVGLMLWTSAYLTLALFVLVPFVALLVTYISRRYRRIGRRVQNVMGGVTGTVDEVVSGQREVKIYGGQQRERNRFEEVTEAARRLNLKVASTSALSSATVQTVAAMSLALIVFMATRPGIIDSLTPGSFTTLIIAMGAILPSLKRLTNVQSDIQRGMAAAEELFAVMDTPPESDHGQRTVERSVGELAFEDVQMQYPGAAVAALQGIRLDCPAGKVTALVGRSGSGKSTLVSLLPRFYEPGAGRITLDGHPLNDYALASLRRQIAWVGQSVVLFDDTVANNIAYGELTGASEAEIIAAAEAANAMEFIRELPDGLNTRIGQGGNTLSGGQRQRIAIARAVLKDAPILILDEATSALDTESERLIQQALTRLMVNRTTLVIAHRLSTVEHADQIAVLDQGRVVELGTHAQLLERDGTYAALHRMQFHDDNVAVTGAD